jgi:hypothetical protein
VDTPTYSTMSDDFRINVSSNPDGLWYLGLRKAKHYYLFLPSSPSAYFSAYTLKEVNICLFQLFFTQKNKNLLSFFVGKVKKHLTIPSL